MFADRIRFLAWSALVPLMLIAADAAVAKPEPAPEPKLALEKSVLLMRHGLRSPNQTPAELAKSASRPWPQWSVGAGEVTDHGLALVTNLGQYYRQRYAAEGLLPAKGCPESGTFASWADNAAARIPLSAQALLNGLYPGCGLKAAFLPQTSIDPIFNPVGAGVCTISAGKARAAVLDAAGGDLDRALSRVRPSMQRLQSLLKVRSFAGCADNAPSCGIENLANVLEDGDEGPKLEGGLKRAATLVENIGFAYMEGMPESDVGWGEAATPEALAKLYAPRNLYLDLLRKPPYLASRHTTALGRAILAALDTAPTVAGSINASRLVAFVGRDQHLAGMAGLLGLQWSLPDQPDDNAPGATLAFERLRDPANGKLYVRVKVYYQTLQQMRIGAALDLAHPPGELALKIPGCGKAEVDGACPLPIVREHFTRAFAADCPANPA